MEHWGPARGPEKPAQKQPVDNTHLEISLILGDSTVAPVLGYPELPSCQVQNLSSYESRASELISESSFLLFIKLGANTLSKQKCPTIGSLLLTATP